MAKKENKKSNEEIITEIKKQITEKIRPALVMDGGNIEFVDYKDGVVEVKLLGACHGCPMASITLKSVLALFAPLSILPTLTKPFFSSLIKGRSIMPSSCLALLKLKTR